MNKKTIRDIDLKNKTVIMRGDFNVPLDDSQNINDNSRILATLPTIRYILDKKAKLILMTHIGRPKGKVFDSMRVTPVAKELSRLLNINVITSNDCIGKEVKDIISKADFGDVILLENLRFHKEEEKNDPNFAKELSSLADIYVNDAFGTAHRAHASTEGITKYLPSVAGFLIEKELEYLGNALSNPKRPFVAIIGGAKVSTKISVLNSLLDKVNVLIIGGGMSYTFCKAMGNTIGNSLVEDDFINTAKEVIKKANDKKVTLVIPSDHVIADKFDNEANSMVIEGDIPNDFIGMDIGPKTIELIKSKIKNAKTVLWNGPLGVFEMSNFSKGTFFIAKAIANIDAITVVGGGDSVSAINKSGIADKISHISTGGGASIEFIEGKSLPGIESLLNK